jgi:NAD(P)-dependent dehydrogenase (short-subunit alcohol dehydrogenase family)
MNTVRDDRSKAVIGGALLSAVAAGLILRRQLKRKFSFRGKTVLLTGGSRGLGLELARILAREGAQLCLIARNAATLETASMELKALGCDVLAIPCDVRDRDQVKAVVAQTLNAMGRIDLLINNAGVIQVGPFEQMTLQDFENAMATHVWAPLYFSLAVLPYMRLQGGGRIINMCSIGGKVAVPHLLPYAMSKFALSGLSEGLAMELAQHHIRVLTVYPGLMRTGSHVNASFKGNYPAEFALFSMAAGLPVVSINAQRAARQIIEACRDGKEELIITPAAGAATLAKALMPSIFRRSMHLVSRLLPQSAPLTDNEAHSGWQSQSSWSPSMFTKMADKAIERNNEDRATG